MSNLQIMLDVFEKTLASCAWRPFSYLGVFPVPESGLRLHPSDYYPLGTARGSIKERWFSSVIVTMNVPLAPPDEGMSYVDVTGKREDLFLFKDAVDELSEKIIGKELKDRFGTWPMYSKFFDYNAPLFHHLHLREEDAWKVIARKARGLLLSAATQ